jgi:hypothetical protein
VEDVGVIGEGQLGLIPRACQIYPTASPRCDSAATRAWAHRCAVVRRPRERWATGSSRPPESAGFWKAAVPVVAVSCKENPHAAGALLAECRGQVLMGLEVSVELGRAEACRCDSRPRQPANPPAGAVRRRAGSATGGADREPEPRNRRPSRVTPRRCDRLFRMSTATHPGATDGVHVLDLLITYPARLWLASRSSPSPGRQPAAIHYFRSPGTRGWSPRALIPGRSSHVPR